MTGRLKHYFVCANSSKGFVNYFDSNLTGLKKVYILKGGPGTGKSTLMKKIGTKYLGLDYEVEYIHCSSDPDSLDGVIVRNLGFAIVDGTAPHIIEPKVPGAIEEYVNLGVAWKINELEQNIGKIMELQKKIGSCYPKAYQSFETALKIHDEWEKYYIQHMNFDAAQKLTDHMITILLPDKVYKDTQQSRHRFFGGATSKGVMDYVEDLTKDYTTRFFIKGRPGTGKSTMLKKILKRAEELGIDCEVYHCGFDPDSLDMLMFPELSACIFDSTAPHEYYPSKEGDCILDVYEELVEEDVDENYAEELMAIAARYKMNVTQGVEYLKQAKSVHDELEKIYIQATDFEKINSIVNLLMRKIK